MMQDVDDFEMFAADPVEHGMTRPDEIAAQSGGEIVPRPAAVGKQGKATETSDDTGNHPVGSRRIVNRDRTPDFGYFDPGRRRKDNL